MENKIKKIGLGEKLGFMSFSAATNVAFNFKSIYYTIFLDVICGLGVKWAGIIVAIGTVWDAVNDPLIALFCTNRRFKNGEKVRPYALWMCVPWALTIVLMFTNFGFTDKTWTIVVALLVYFAFEALYTFLCMPYNSMAALATNDDADRASINAFRGLGGCLGSAIGTLLIPTFITLFGGDSKTGDDKIYTSADTTAIFWTACVMGVICIIGSLIHYFTTTERVKPREDDVEVKLTFFEAYKRLFKCKSWILNMCFILGYGIIQAFIMNNVTYYAQTVIGDKNASTPILAGYLVVAVIISLVGPAIDRKIGRKKTTILSLIVTLVGIIPYLIFPTQIWAIIILAICMGFGLTFTFIIFNTNRNNISDVLEVQNKQRMDTLVAGGDNLITKLAEAGAIFVMTQIYDLVNFDASKGTDQPAGAFTAMYIFLGVVPIVCSIFMAYFGSKINIPKELEDAKKANMATK